MNLFADLGVSEGLCGTLAARGIETPTAVQKKIIPLLMEGKSVVFRSETGTGKTFAYLLPALSRCAAESQSGRVRILIAAPTHELASQIKRETSALLENFPRKEKAALFIGGASWKRQREMLKKPPLAAVGGPTRLTEWIRSGNLKTGGLFFVVLDEVDRLLKKENRDELQALLAVLPAGVQFAICSATVNEKRFAEIRSLLPPDAAQRLQLEILPDEGILQKSVTHWAFFAEQRKKTEELRKFLHAAKPEKSLVFFSSTERAQRAAEKLRLAGIPCACLVSGMDKIARKSVTDRFRTGKTPVLITSDVAGRGMDIPDITHVIQMDIGSEADVFVHRAGRTGRAGKTGIHVVFGDEFELRRLAVLEKQLGITVYPKILWGGKILRPEDLPSENQ